MIFGFSLYVIFLLVTLIIYFESGLGELNRLGLLKSNKMCCCQHWKRVSILVDFQDKASTV